MCLLTSSSHMSLVYQIICNTSFPFPNSISLTHTKKERPPIWRQDWGSPPSLKACFQCLITVIYSVSKHPLSTTMCCSGFQDCQLFWVVVVAQGPPKGNEFSLRNHLIYCITESLSHFAMLVWLTQLSKSTILLLRKKDIPSWKIVLRVVSFPFQI